LFDPTVAAGNRRASRAVLAAGALLLAVGVIGVLLVFRFVAAERTRDLQAWQIRLGIVADSRATAVDEWLEQQFGVLRDLAQNASVQLYMTEISLAGGDRTQVTDQEAQAGYLRNLLTATAEREGFGAAAASQVNANISRAGTAGIGLWDAKGQVIATSPGMPPLDARHRDFLNQRKPGGRALLDLHVGPTGQPLLGFAVPLFALQGDSSSQEIGVVFAVRPVAAELARRMVQPGETESSAETVLVRAAGKTVEYLSRLRDGTPPLTRTMALDTPNLDAAFALANPGGFAQKTDYAGRTVLVTARALAVAPWTLLRKIDAAEALAETEYRGRVLLSILLGAILLVAVVVVAVWRHGTSLRAAESAERFRVLADRFSRLSGFMRVVTDAQPTAIAAVDGHDRITFANKRAGESLGVAPEDLVGKLLDAALGPARADMFEALNKKVRNSQQPMTDVHAFGLGAGGADRVVKSDHIPLPTTDEPGAVLMVVEDITDLVRERQRRENALNRLVDALVSLVDRRDPYSANHSVRVAEVAREIAEEMKLSPAETSTARIAAALMNLGKMLVPDTLLTKQGRLDDAEMRLIRDSLQASADLISAIEFDGPVAETMRQLQENFDGSGGPRQLHGDAILLPARIVAVANAFVAMVSPRAWRPGLDMEAASQQLLRDAGAKFDRRVVVALINLLDNRGARLRWTHYGELPATVAAG